MNKHSGYIALISAIIISALLMMTLQVASLSGFFARFNALDSESKEISAYAAEGCVRITLLKLAEDFDYAGNENQLIGSRPCKISVIETIGNYKIIESQSIINSTYTNLRVRIDKNTFSIISWQEVSHF
jgi:hypothetical protein